MARTIADLEGHDPEAPIEAPHVGLAIALRGDAAGHLEAVA